MRDEAGLPGRRGDLFEQGAGAVGVARAAPVEGPDRVLVLESHAGGPDPVIEMGIGERPHAGGEGLQARIDLGLFCPGRETLEPMVADVGERIDADHPPRILGLAAGDARDEREPFAQGLQHPAGGSGNARLLR